MSRISAGEAATILGCTRQNVDRLRKLGKLNGLKDNSLKWTYDRDAVLAIAGDPAKPRKRQSNSEGKRTRQVAKQAVAPILSNVDNELQRNLNVIAEQLGSFSPSALNAIKEAHQGQINAIMHAHQQELDALKNALEDQQRQVTNLKQELAKKRGRGLLARVVTAIRNK